MSNDQLIKENQRMKYIIQQHQVEIETIKKNANDRYFQLEVQVVNNLVDENKQLTEDLMKLGTHYNILFDIALRNKLR